MNSFCVCASCGDGLFSEPDVVATISLSTKGKSEHGSLGNHSGDESPQAYVGAASLTAILSRGQSRGRKSGLRTCSHLDWIPQEWRLLETQGTSFSRRLDSGSPLTDFLPSSFLSHFSHFPPTCCLKGNEGEESIHSGDYLRRVMVS